MKIFSNSPNQKITNSDGKEYWISRSITVNSVVIAIDKDFQYNVLVTTRSDQMDHSGKYCLPCGYLDWYETIYDAMIREVFEETSLYLPSYQKFCISNNDKKPYTINDNPFNDERQNVSFTFLTILDFSQHMSEFPFYVTTYKTDEVSKVEWMSKIKFYNEYDNEKWAFNHNHKIQQILNDLSIKEFNDPANIY